MTGLSEELDVLNKMQGSQQECARNREELTGGNVTTHFIVRLAACNYCVLDNLEFSTKILSWKIQREPKANDGPFPGAVINGQYSP